MEFLAEFTVIVLDCYCADKLDGLSVFNREACRTLWGTVTSHAAHFKDLQHLRILTLNYSIQNNTERFIY